MFVFYLLPPNKDDQMHSLCYSVASVFLTQTVTVEEELIQILNLTSFKTFN